MAGVELKILVCGGRDYYKYSVVKDNLENIINEIWLENEEEEITIIQGGATGADFLAKVFVLDEYSEYLKLEEYKAEWGRYGKAAGGIRNQQMLDEGKPDLVIAFPGGVGTADMVRRAKKAGVKVIEVRENT